MLQSKYINTSLLKNQNYTIVIAIVVLQFFSGFMFAQKDAQKIYDGNKFYFDSNYVRSTYAYREALKLNSKNYKANFNLGNSLYRNGLEVRASKEGVMQGKTKVSPDSLANLIFEEAAQNFAIVANTVSDKDTLHQAWHNIGNCYLQKKDYEQAINAYKKALRYNPKDEDTRYNLAYALKHQPPKQNKGGGASQDQKQNQDNKDKKQQQQPKISKEDAERLLKALMNAEKKTQDKRKQQKEDASKSNPDKDW